MQPSPNTTIQQIFKYSLALLLAITLWSAWTALPAYAQGPVVDTAIDENDGECGDGDCSLRDAIQTASAGDTITFAADYTITLTMGSQLSINKELTIDGSGYSVTVSGNNAVRVFDIQSSGVVTLSYMTVVSGAAGSNFAGGGIGNWGILTVNDSAISGNSADWGGGIANYGTLTTYDSTFSGNLANGQSGNQGGGIYNAGALTIQNTTIVSNTAISGGGGIYNFGSSVITLTNSIAAYNGSGGDCYVQSGSIVDGGYNLDSDNTCGLSATGSLSNTDPLLDPLADNGGDTQTHALQSGSPALDQIPVCSPSSNPLTPTPPIPAIR